ncbi:MAG: hypothetical protein H0X51_04990 [Parachlamydiaceae bacterium]|nr:hypothetical protein [Parachlamydiaceae bacterium]
MSYTQAVVHKDFSITSSLPAAFVFVPVDKVSGRRICFFLKLVQTVILRPPVTAITLAVRLGKLLTWVPIKAGVYKLTGYHTEASDFFERSYLDTGKALRDLLFIPSVVRRAFQDMVARREIIMDDIPSRPAAKDKGGYLAVAHTDRTYQYSSYLHGCGSFTVIKPEIIGDHDAPSDGSLKTVMASHMFTPGIMAINFGTPNVATLVTEAGEKGSVKTSKIDAKSLWRDNMTYGDSRGRAQSGLFFVPKNLPEGALERFKTAAVKAAEVEVGGKKGRKDVTCVNTNCRVLQEAGFSIEGVAMDGVVFPNTLMEHLLFRRVFYTTTDRVKHRVHFDILNTTNKSLEEFATNVDTAVIGTRLRHRRRASDTDENKKARGVAAQAMIKSEQERIALAESEPEQKVREEGLGKRKITISVPSFLGNIAAQIWGRHTMFEVDLADKRDRIAQAFSEAGAVKLKPFPQKKPSCGTRLKRDFFFSRPMIGLLRRHMMGRADVIHLNAQDIFRKLKGTKGDKINYVLLDDKVVLARVQANGDTKEGIKKAADWALSKHALLAGRQAVHCSGEMWYDESSDSYIMNSDSGTYLPDARRVAIVAGLANEFFGDRFRVAEAETKQERAA